MITLYDYHLSAPGVKFFNFKSNGEGSHVPELQIQYSGNEVFPAKFMGAYNLYNDPEKSFYFELGYSLKPGNYNLDLCMGFTKGPSAIYFVEKNKYALINLGIFLSRTIELSKDISIPVALNYIINGYLEKSFLIFKISL